MANFKLPHFGMIDPGSLEEYYDVDIDFNGTAVQVDLNFDNKTIEDKRLETVKQFIENLRIHDLNNKKHIEKDYNDEEGDTVKFYLEHHLEELGEDELAGLVEPGSKPATHEKQLIKKLKLVRVGLYPDSEDQFAIFDYSIGQELTNYLVVINTDENGNLDYLTMES
ncbi:MAG: DUF2004 domain-containing protein [Chitinophagaceae bacterium]|nr:DUF2004 domain-containing protein [Chitinophagaceae bacterium]